MRPVADVGGPSGEVGPYLLRLYVSGRSARAARAVRNLESVAALVEGVEIEVIDVHERPELAEGDKVLATPTLIRRRPPPVRKVIGDLSDAALVVASLELDAARPTAEGGDLP